MSFKIGASGGKNWGSSSSTSTIDKTTAPIVPSWMQDQTQGLATKISNLGNTDASQYIAGANPFQTAAANATSKIGNPWNMDAAVDVTRGIAGQNPTSILAHLQDYMSPYTKDVVDASAADFDHNAEMQRAQESLDMANQGAFGGSGAAITRSLGEDNRGRARATLLSGLRDQGFQTGANLSVADANQKNQARATQLAAAAQLGQLSTANDANQRANAGQLFDMGTTLQGYDQSAATAPLDLASWAASTFGGLPLNLFVGQHETGTDTTNGKSQGSYFGVSASGGRG